MSLRVWLPLGGDLKNQGLDASVTPTLSNAFLEGPGKISQKSLQIASGRYLTIPYISNNEHLSIALWIKPNSPSAWCNIFSFGGDSLNRAEKGDTSNRIYYWFSDNPSLIQSGTQIFSLTDETNWFHLIMTADGSQVKFYINGQLKSTSTQLNTISTIMDSGYVLFGARSVSGNQPYASYMNDVRIYDHCLSQKEVNLLAQGLVAHYPIKAPFLPNLLQGVEQYTKETPLVRNVYDVGRDNWQDFYIYHTNITANIKWPGRYLFVLNADGIPRNHAYDTDNTTENRKYMICLRNKANGAHPIWQEFQISKDGRHYGFLDIETAGEYDLRTNLYLYNNQGSNYTVKFWDMQLFECDKYIPEMLEPVSISNAPTSICYRLGLEKCFTQDASGYGNHATLLGTLTATNGPISYSSCAEFDGASCLNCGRSAMVTDEITVSGWFYSDDWLNAGRPISCAQNGGWDFRKNGDGYMTMEVRRNGAYIWGVSETKVSSWSKGWHHIVGTYDGYKAEIYVDSVKGNPSEVSSTKYPITYHTTNALFIGAEAGESNVTPDGVYFVGKAFDVKIYGKAFTEEEVVALYNTNISIDDDVLMVTNLIESNHSSLVEDGIVITGNLSQIDVPLSNMKIKTLPDGSVWARIHNLDLTEQNNVFQDNEEVDNCDAFGKYSKMSLVDELKTSRLPDGYVEVEYIESTGTQYINTGFVPDSNASIEIDFEYKGSVTGTTVEALFGARKDTADSVFGMWISKTRVFPHYGNATYTGNGYFSSGNDEITTSRSTYKYKKNVAYYNDSSITCGTTGDFNSTYNLCLLAMNSKGTIDPRRAIGKLYGCKIWNGEALIREFVPCKNSAGIYGLYDLVYFSFYPSADSSAFLGSGTVVYHQQEFMLTYPSIDTTLPSEYAQLEYVEADGRQWINTGVTDKARWEFDIQFPKNEMPIIPKLTQNNEQIIIEEDTSKSTAMKEDQKWRAFYAFDGNEGTHGDVCYGQGFGMGVIIGYNFNAPWRVSEITLTAYVDAGGTVGEAYLQVYVNNQWINAVTLSTSNFTNRVATTYFINIDSARGIRLVVNSTSNGYGIIIQELQVYGYKRQLMGYSTSGSEYWGVQFDKEYGVGANWGRTGAQAGGRDSLVHCYGEDGQAYISVQNNKATVALSSVDSDVYQLFSLNSSTNYSCYAKLYNCNCIQNGRLIRKFIPALRSSDNVVGLYDLVNKQFYTSNSGTHLFAGPKVKKFKLLEFLENTGEQYINTGFTVGTAAADDVFIAEAVVSVSSLTGDRQFLFAFDNPSYNHYAEFNASGVYGCMGNYIGSAITPNTKYQVKMRIDGGSSTTLTINGVSQTTTAYAGTIWGTFNLFRINDTYKGSNIRIHWIKMTYNGQVVREYIPVVDETGELGMLDLIENKFYANAGTGTFVKQEYTQLEYIESTGAQYINTGVVPSETLETEISFIPTGGLTEHAIFGSSWAANGYFLMFYNNQIRWHSGGNWVDIGSYSAGDKVVCHCANKYIIVNGTTYLVDGGENTTNPITILDNMGYSPGGKGIGKIEYIKMWENGKLIRDFIPVQKTDGVVCLYDKQNKQYYTNAGTEVFKPGPRVIFLASLPSIEQYNRWIQTNSPNANYRQSTGYQPIHTDFCRWNGSKYSSGPITKSFDQEHSAYLVSESNDPWAPIGQKELYGTGIRALNNTTQHQVELWVRVDKMPEATEVKTNNRCVIAPQFIEY